MRTYLINVPDDLPQDELKKILSQMNISFIEDDETLKKGTFLPKDKPSDFVPIWDQDERDIKEIRKNAWKRK